MKSQNPLRVGLKPFVVAMAVVALIGVSTVQAAALPNQITVHTQELNTGVIVVDSVTAAAGGWIVVYKSPDFNDGDLVGYAPVHQGVNTNVKVTIDTAEVGDLPTLWARLQVDNEVKGLFEWGGLRGLPYNDGPVVQNGQYVVAAFGTATRFETAAAPTPVAAKPVATKVVSAAPTASAPKGPKSNANQITIRGQDLNTGVIVVDSVTAAADGWIVVYKSPDFNEGDLVGYAPVHQGVNTNVKVTINTAEVGDLPTLWARLHVDNDVKGLFEWGLRDLPFNDGPVIQNGQPVVVTFGTS